MTKPNAKRSTIAGAAVTAATAATAVAALGWTVHAASAVSGAKPASQVQQGAIAHLESALKQPGLGQFPAATAPQATITGSKSPLPANAQTRPSSSGYSNTAASTGAASQYTNPPVTSPPLSNPPVTSPPVTGPPVTNPPPVGTGASGVKP